MLKRMLYFAIYILSIVLIIPISVVFISNKFDNVSMLKEEKNIDDENIINEIEIDNMNSNLNVNESNLEMNKFEEYIVGVVAAEMPVSFEEEALKAQAVAARTYAYRRIDDINSDVDYNSIGQAYSSIDELKSLWGENFEQYYNKIRTAVSKTYGIIMTYENEPIEAVFHSTSAGITELSENIWGMNLPYIKSVESKVDENAPNFIYTITIDKNTIINKISQKIKNIDNEEIIDTFKIKTRSEAGYVLDVEVCGEIISGRDIRSMFNLRSTNFTIEKNGDSITFTTKGYGHGAGMSQYGANFMAEDGKTYEEILNHYYSGIEIQKIY